MLTCNNCHNYDCDDRVDGNFCLAWEDILGHHIYLFKYSCRTCEKEFVSPLAKTDHVGVGHNTVSIYRMFKKGNICVTMDFVCPNCNTHSTVICTPVHD